MQACPLLSQQFLCVCGLCIFGSVMKPWNCLGRMCVCVCVCIYVIYIYFIMFSSDLFFKIMQQIFFLSIQPILFIKQL